MIDILIITFKTTCIRDVKKMDKKCLGQPNSTRFDWYQNYSFWPVSSAQFATSNILWWMMISNVVIGHNDLNIFDMIEWISAVDLNLFCSTECEAKCWWPPRGSCSNCDILLERRSKFSAKFQSDNTNASSLLVCQLTTRTQAHCYPTSDFCFSKCCLFTWFSWYKYFNRKNWWIDWGNTKSTSGKQP